MISRNYFLLPLLFLAVSVDARARLSEKQVAKAEGANAVPAQLAEVGITEHLGGSVLSEDLSFRNERGESVRLASFFQKGKPVVLALAYYECPNLCTLVLNGLVESLKNLQWTPGQDFEVVTVSIDPRETPALALEKKAAYLDAFMKADGTPQAAGKRAALERGWHFLTGQETQIRALARLVGFGYKWDPAEQQYAHGAVIYALTPDGRISRYLYGISYQSKDLKLALLEASSGKIGNVIERFMLFCYRYDQKTRKYSVYLENLMRAGSAGTLVVFGGYLAVFWRRQRRRGSSPSASSHSSPSKEPGSHA